MIRFLFCVIFSLLPLWNLGTLLLLESLRFHWMFLFFLSSSLWAYRHVYEFTNPAHTLAHTRCILFALDFLLLFCQLDPHDATTVLTLFASTCKLLYEY